MAYGYLSPDEARKRRRKYYLANRVRFVAYARARQDKFRSWVQKQKERPCADCKKRYPYYVMDFDHRGDQPKLFNIARLYRRTSWAKTKAEIAKCDVVCSNCHRQRTHRRKENTKRIDKTATLI